MNNVLIAGILIFAAGFMSGAYVIHSDQNERAEEKIARMQLDLDEASFFAVRDQVWGSCYVKPGESVNYLFRRDDTRSTYDTHLTEICTRQKVCDLKDASKCVNTLDCNMKWVKPGDVLEALRKRDYIQVSCPK